MDFTLKDIILTVLGLFGGALFSIWQARKFTVRKSICYSYEIFELITPEFADFPDLRIQIADTQVRSLFGVKIRMWNGGNAVISKDDFLPNMHPVLKVHDSPIIHLSITAKITADTIQLERNELGQYRITPDFWLPREEISLKILCIPAERDTSTEISPEVELRPFRLPTIEAVIKDSISSVRLVNERKYHELAKIILSESIPLTGGSLVSNILQRTIKFLVRFI